MTKNDLRVWIRIFDYSGGGGQDVMFQPLLHNSFSDWQKKLTDTFEAMDMADFLYVDWEYNISESAVSQMVSDEDHWDAWDDYFDLCKEFGVDAENFWKAINVYWSGDMPDLREWVEENFQGEWDKMLDFAYDFVNDVYGDNIPEDLAERYFDFDGFGLALKANGDLSSLIMDDWEDRYDTEAEAQAVYDKMYDMRNEEVAEWYIYDVVGDLTEALGSQMSTFFDYQKFARDLEYDYYIEKGYVFRNS